MPEFDIDISENVISAFEELAQEYGDKNAASAFREPLKQAAQPIENDIKRRTPVDTGELQKSVGTRIRRPTAASIRNGTNDRFTVLVANIGWIWRRGQTPVNSRQALAVEYGNETRSATPVIRPAFSAGIKGAVSRFSASLGNSLTKAAQRLERRAKRSNFKVR